MSQNNQDSQNFRPFPPIRNGYNLDSAAHNLYPDSKTRINGFSNHSAREEYAPYNRNGHYVDTPFRNMYYSTLQARNEYAENSNIDIGEELYFRSRENGRNKNFQQTAHHPETIVVIGTGDLGLALLTCLIRHGYRVIVGSRNPDKNRHKVAKAGGKIDNYTNALKQGSIAIVAIPVEGFTNLPVNLFEGKIVVDVSNKTLQNKREELSLACKLQNVLPRSRIVKAFNTLSAYGLQSNLLQGSKEIPVCSDDEKAKLAVMNLVRNLGFNPVDFGNLSNAAKIEEIPLKFFPEWKLAGKLSLGIFIFAFLIQLFRKQLCPNFQALSDNKEWDWSLCKEAPLVDCQTAFAFTAITLLATCYLPGVIASFLQIYRGTKYSEFPKWLDNWLRSRRQIGLITEAFALMHALMAILTLIQESWHDDWKTYLYVTLGCFSIGLITILAVMSLPTMSQSLTWREFSFMQRYLGWWALVFALLHLIFKKWSKLISNGQRCIVIPEGGQIFIILPLITVLLKLVLLLPCIDNRVQKIRRGHERNLKNQNEN